MLNFLRRLFLLPEKDLYQIAIKTDLYISEQLNKDSPVLAERKVNIWEYIFSLIEPSVEIQDRFKYELFKTTHYSDYCLGRNISYLDIEIHDLEEDVLYFAFRAERVVPKKKS